MAGLLDYLQYVKHREKNADDREKLLEWLVVFLSVENVYDPEEPEVDDH